MKNAIPVLNGPSIKPAVDRETLTSQKARIILPKQPPDLSVSPTPMEHFNQDLATFHMDGILKNAECSMHSSIIRVGLAGFYTLSARKTKQQIVTLMSLISMSQHPLVPLIVYLVT